jgi:putative ABC transport system permease protein
MSATPLWRRYLRFWGPDPAADVDDEFAFHVQARVDELVAEGMSPRQARDEALRGFGNIDAVKRTCRALAQGQLRAERRTEWWFGWRQDLRYAVRQLRASPVLTAVLVATLAIGIGATVSVFSVLNAVLLRPLPFADSDRIVLVYETWRSSRGNASVGHFHDWAEQATVFEHTSATQRATYNLSDGEPERVSGARATPGYFRVAYVPPRLGRYFTERDLEGDPRLVVLSDGLWRRRFAGDRSIVGRTIRLDGESHTVVGVAAAEYNMTPSGPQLWTPLVFTPQQRANYGNHSFTVIAKMKAGVTQAAAQADLELVTRGIAERQPQNMEGRSVNVQMFRDVLLGGNFRTGLYVLLSSVLFVLLIGCVNIANLLLARAAIRRREIAIRSAIGGGRWRIVRQLLTESLVLALTGGSAGLALAYVGVRLFVKFGWVNVPRLHEASLQTEVLLFALGITVLTGLMFGLAPAVRAARESLLTTLREGGRTSLLAAAHDRVRTSLVVAEVALAVVLLVGAGLFIRSAWKLQHVPLGFETADSITARVALPPDRYEDDAAVADVYRRMLEAIRAMPGIEYAGASTAIPLLGGGPDAGMRIDGKPFTPATMLSPRIRLISEQYIEAIGIPLRRGRTMQANDMKPGARPVVVINERLAAAGWPGEDPIGKRLSTWAAAVDVPEWREVIGVVGDVRSLGPDTPPAPELFIPYTQPPSLAWVSFQRSMALVARTRGDAAAHAGSLRRAVRFVDPSLPLFELQTMEEVVDAWGASTRFSTSLLLLLALIGLLLAAIGIYGVIAYFVAQRTPEIGLRLALGASPRSVLVMVLRHGARLTATGIALGVIVALGLTRLLTAMLFEITPTDGLSYAVGGAGLFAVALLACVIPARRAVKVDPVRALAAT